MTEEEARFLHKASSRHREALLRASTCGCFYCDQFFSASKIEEWIDGGETALCPCCGVDAVLPDVSLEQLQEMNRYWFATASVLVSPGRLEALEARVAALEAKVEKP